MTDKGSLNGTCLNTEFISLGHSSGPRKDGMSHALADGDVVSTGSATRILVSITFFSFRFAAYVFT